MIKIDIISGFLGAGKTTFIKKMLDEVYKDEKIALIENEFGEVGIDGGFLKDSGVNITEMNSGCICCSLVGDFGKNLNEVITAYKPDRIIIEPSGVGKLSDVMKSVIDVEKEQDVKLNALVTVVNAKKASKQMKAFGEFFNNQIEFATTIVLSRTQNTTPEQLELCVKQMQELNKKAAIITTPWDAIAGEQILKVIEGQDSLEMKVLAEEAHKKEEAEHEHEHHHDHDHDEHEHHHDHDHGDSCSCGHHHTQEELDAIHAELGCEGACGSCDLCDSCIHSTFHHHHHADEVFTSWGRETPRKYSREELQDILSVLAMTEDYGTILRSKGMVPDQDSEGWLHFDLVPGEFQIREGSADYTGRLCVIGAGLDEARLEKLFLLA